MKPPLKICKSKPQPPPRMPTYATTKSILWAILGLNKQGTHLANIVLHILMVGIGKGKQSLNVCQTYLYAVKGHGVLTKSNQITLNHDIIKPH